MNSEFKSSDEGKWETSPGKFYGDEKNKGLSLRQVCLVYRNSDSRDRFKDNNRLPVV